MDGFFARQISTNLKGKDDPRTYLMQTSDGGANWKRINIQGADVNARLVRIIFSRGRGWVFGEEGAIFTTRDSGVTWTRLQSPTRHLLLGGTFIDDDRGWLVGAGATIIQTSDGGETWHISRLVDASRAGIRFACNVVCRQSFGWAVGERRGHDGLAVAQTGESGIRAVTPVIGQSVADRLRVDAIDADRRAERLRAALGELRHRAHARSRSNGPCGRGVDRRVVVRGRDHVLGEDLRLDGARSRVAEALRDHGDRDHEREADRQRRGARTGPARIPHRVAASQ